MIKTPICDLLGIEYPIFQGGMAWISEGRLAAAVSNGGGLGIISAMNLNAEYLKQQIDLCRSPDGQALWRQRHAHVSSRGGGCQAGGPGACACGDHRRGKPLPLYAHVAGGRREGGAGGGQRGHGQAGDQGRASAIIAEGGESGGMWET